jgi:YfiH family protein
VGSQGRLPPGDALLTDQPGILLSVQTADCLPILLVDPSHRAVAAVHAGWRGLLQRIAEKTVGEMQRAFHLRPEELRAAIGPSIRACCYEVGQEVVEMFRGRFTGSEGYFGKPSDEGAKRIAPKPQHPLATGRTPPFHGSYGAAPAHLDLVAIARDQLQNAGLRSESIYVADFCTACRTDLFFSHRKEGATGRMMAVIGMI